MPLFDLTVKPLPARPVDVINPAPVMVLAAPLLLSRVTPPLALTAPATAILLLFVSENVPLPAVADEIEMARPD